MQIMELSRRDALYKYKRPCVIFFKLKSKCAACDSTLPIWERLCADPTFNGKVVFIVYSFGEDPISKNNYQVAPEYTNIIGSYKEVPIFLLHLPNDTIIDLQHGPPVRNFENMKDVIIDALSTTPYRLSTSS
jgi:thiol-disulfide isomerase/thioredoxin